MKNYQNLVVVYEKEYYLCIETIVEGDKLKIFHPGRLEVKEIYKDNASEPIYIGCAKIFESYAQSRLDLITT